MQMAILEEVMESANNVKRSYPEENVSYRERYFNGYCAVISHSANDHKWRGWIIQDSDIVLVEHLPTSERAHEWFRTAEKHLFLHLAQAG